ncbi:MAG: cell division protein ZapA [Bacteroidales bacterium]|nr:cell division protein ZapA [Bacteroidales bacterium]
MDELAISVKIADRPYKMTVKAEEEEVIRKAARLINKKIEEYANTYAFNDNQDLLAMVSLWFSTSSLKAQTAVRTDNDDLINGLQTLEKLLSEHKEG